MLLPGPTAPTNSHTPWNVEGIDVLDTKILDGTQRRIGTSMALSALSPEAPCGMGLI